MGLKIKGWKWWVIAALPVQLLLVAWAASAPAWVEGFYARGIYPHIAIGIRATSRLLPIPTGQLIFYGLLLVIVVQLIRLGRRKRSGKITWKQFLSTLLFEGVYFFSIFYFLFMLTWGLNYHRQPVSTITGLSVEEIETSELRAMCEVLINKCNDQRSQITLRDGELPLTDGEILDQALIGFNAAPATHNFLSYDLPSVKSVLVPQLMSLFGVGGIYFMFTAEANVNMDPPNFLVPATTCHEMAHQLGFASEDEANYISYLATQFNPDPSFQYSGNLMAMRYSMRALYRIDSLQYNELLTALNEDVLEDIRVTREYWQSFDNPLEPVSDVIYDLFLKANNQRAGIASYSEVVRLFVGEYRKGGLDLTVDRSQTKTVGSP